MTLAKGQNIQVIEKKITVQEALDADEAFFTGTAAAVTPIRSINDTK
jgi:branched-chain amino acid aminotransferase